MTGDALIKVVLFCSGGKDGLAALEALRAEGGWDVRALLTTFNERHGRVAMHGTRRALMRRQAAVLDLPLIEVDLPEDCDNATYEARVAAALAPCKARGVTHVACGDLFLEDIRDYRRRQLCDLGLEPVFPVWGRDTRAMAEALVGAGWEITLNCVDTSQLDAVFLGRRIDRDFLADLPAGVDPCGENGEFHTFVSRAPMFSSPVPVRPGECVVSRDRFHFLDLLPA